MNDFFNKDRKNITDRKKFENVDLSKVDKDKLLKSIKKKKNNEIVRK